MASLSKTTYLMGLQCPKLLWYRYNAKEEIPEADEAQLAIFDQGHEVGALAKKLFPKGIEFAEAIVELSQVVLRTQEALALRRPLFEPACMTPDCYARADIVVPVGRDQWDIVEVKSSTKVKNINHHDLAFQKHVFTRASLKIRKTFLLHINNAYVRQGAVDPKKFFTKADLTEIVAPLALAVPAKVAEMLAVIAQKDCPAVRIGKQCNDPYECPLIPTCWKFLPERNSVLDLYRVGAHGFKLIHEGITKIADIPESAALTGRQLIQSAYEELARLKNLELDLARRRELLERLGRLAPAWASAIENRLAEHSQPQPPGEPYAAWEWRQLHDELERRASVSFDQLQQRIERLTHQLLDVTAQLVEKQTWMNQIRLVTPEQRRALGLYALYRDKVTKSRKGVLDQHYLQEARKVMEVARQAVPVWIMPLAEVAETFDPRSTSFDVVIIDEASQCDPAALFALYLGKQVVVVGDKEQVTPTVFQDKTEVLNLINTYLTGVPGHLAYDGETSVYELAEPSFGGVIRLTEHFRCAPNIIAFSNNLCYGGDIKPLREASSIPLSPHVVPYRVEGGRERGDNVNEVEAESIASLICAAIEQPEYGKNHEGKPSTFGVVSLVGGQQALKIDSILRQRMDPAEYKRRDILCGDAAQFQGDERDVMFLSVVDTSADGEPLHMRQDGPKRIFKKRFNVAASRARNQMWVVHSLNHETDLQVGDYRRRLIEHALDPEAWERDLQKRLAKVDPRSKVFEGTVLRRLMERGFSVLPQHQAGAYYIDLVVVGNGRRLAVECDGEQFHGPEKLQEDLDRQAILERLGWTFVRIRGSLFFRDEGRALEPVFNRLQELCITPELASSATAPSTGQGEVVERVICRAQELRSYWQPAQNTP